MTYVDLDTIHTPATGSIVPTAWGIQTATNFDVLANRPRARLSGSVTSCVDGTGTGLEWSDPDYDTHNAFRQTQAADRLTAPWDGLYRFTAYARINYTAASGIHVVSIYSGEEDDGVLVARGQATANSSPKIAALATWEYPLEAGEWAQARVYQNLGLDLFCDASFFEMEYLGRSTA